MRSVLFVWLALVVLASVLVSCANRGTAATPGNPSGTPEAAQPPIIEGAGLISSQLLQGNWSTGCVADDTGYPVTYTLTINGSTMRYGKESFSSWDCMGPGYPQTDETLSFELKRVSDDPNDFHVITYDGDPSSFDWVRYYQGAMPALEFVAADYSAAGSYAHRYYKR